MPARVYASESPACGEIQRGGVEGEMQKCVPLTILNDIALTTCIHTARCTCTRYAAANILTVSTDVGVYDVLERGNEGLDKVVRVMDIDRYDC